MLSVLTTSPDKSVKAATPTFTVFTPTYNRAHTLVRVFDSLSAQTFRDFEWLVVDDGSADGTDALIDRWREAADFPVRYVAQTHAGKHVAHNRALREARGEFFVVLDSDDACVPTALERMLHHWNSIPPERRSEFSGVAGLCRDQNRNIIGDRFPSEPLDISLREQHYVYRLRGEKWGPELTGILRQFPFPEIPNVNFMPEGTVWLEVAKKYKIRCVNEVFRIYHVADRATGATLTTRKSLGENAVGRLYYYAWLLNNDIEYFFKAPLRFIKVATMFNVVAFYVSAGDLRTYGSLSGTFAKVLVVLLAPLSLLLYAFDRICIMMGRRHA